MPHLLFVVSGGIRMDTDDRIDPAATTILTLLEAIARPQSTSHESNL